MRILALVPVYNHPAQLPRVVAGLRQHDLPVLLVDDGSEPGCARLIAELGALPGTSVARHPHNRGKGAAIMTGLEWARRQGYSHLLQIDADGQHELGDVPSLIDAAQRQPEALISGLPVFAADVPRLRYYSRYLTHVWVWINTWSLDIRDSMCGFRIYPVAACCQLLERQHPGARMSFDPEILVRFHWQGGAIVFVPTPVRYPADGSSHFRLLDDNLRLAYMHTRMFFGMLRRAPRWLARRWRTSGSKLA
jgi:glycosyltransferase involved in cell wall biosynthesis